MESFTCTCNAQLIVGSAWTAFRCACGESWTKRWDANDLSAWRRQVDDFLRFSRAKVTGEIA